MRASDRAYATLLDEIQSGSLRPGTVLGEVEQAARLGVSRTPLREAIARLISDGLLVQQSPRVTTVAPIAVSDVRALFTVRRALEETAAATAAARPERSEFDALAAEFDAIVDDDLDDDRVEDYYALIARFDLAIDRAVGNDYLTSALRTVRAHLVRLRRLARDRPERLRASVGEHRLIAAAIADGDAELAAHATHIHLHNALVGILAAMDALAEPSASTEGAA